MIYCRNIFYLFVLMFTISIASLDKFVQSFLMRCKSIAMMKYSEAFWAKTNTTLCAAKMCFSLFRVVYGFTNQALYSLSFQRW
mmetsp:Transcript_30877/g.47330  ORF Transcript_30877/g.47330 Transcript_30877/m.47330 type:complete len:83 (-) Transcript_30877:532-780(-)